ncbi:hypothetical protein [Brevifollis gellanilyticus]|nr:hypothetical protein [Brevifollis gellanilyticus]
MKTLLRSPALLVLAFTLVQPLSRAQAGEPAPPPLIDTDVLDPFAQGRMELETLVGGFIGVSYHF